MTEEQQSIRELEDRVGKLEATIIELMDFVYDSCQLQRPDSNDAAELFKLIKQFQGE